MKTLLKTGANVNEIYKGVSLLNKVCGGVHRPNNERLKILLDSPTINVKTITLTTPGYGNDMATTPLVVLLSSAIHTTKDNVVRLIKIGVNINYHSAF